MVRGSLLLMLLLNLAPYPANAWATDAWYSDKERGWFWKEAPPPPPKPPTQPPDALPAAATPAPKPVTAAQEMAALKAGLEEAKAEAILRPTPANVAHYLALQERTMNQAMLFTDMWQRVRWANPALDYAFVHPTAAGGVRIEREMTREEQKNVLNAVAQDNGIVFFFKRDCPYCQEQARILQALVQTHGISVLAVSLDGASSPYFPAAKPDNGIAARMGVQDAPAMFIVNPDTQETLPLGYGVVPMDEIESRIRRLVMMPPGVY
ncbi:conjugal transfer protein TraF [Thiothrix subterranea]|uniref:Conjugal transfer protein TraF n=2 Tax=Thiothrix subterranea TaxID=2735563 RepID=A0AA51MQW6_9GAMM|nr:conjugal transfer protein TraF [Thiothrix subterranea]MDQ5767915.1 conjugal transfer protein TraF [Thiothrix subterranea]WML86626.1 conjugal transfer protein TraF [Thiothrix subterranea]